MANELEHIDDTGLTVYAKPTPIVASPWATDAVSLTEVSTSGYYSADVVNPAIGYVVYSQAGGSAVLADEKLGTITKEVAAIAPSGNRRAAGEGVTATNLDQVGGGGGGTAPISPIEVSSKRTFFVGREGHRSSSVVTLARAPGSGGKITLAIEPELNDSADIDINGTHTVTVVGNTTLVVSSINTRPDGMALHFDIPSDSLADIYEVSASVVTLDTQSISMTGKLVIE